MSTLMEMAPKGAALTGLDARLCVGWWYAENGEQWPTTNNPSNISYNPADGEPAFPPNEGIWKGVVKVHDNRVVEYGTPEEGVEAWALLLNTPCGTDGKVLTLDTSMLKGKTLEEQCKTIGQSNWASSHYRETEFDWAGHLIWDAWHNTVVSAWFEGQPEAPAQPEHPEDVTRLIYKVAEGDTLGQLADRHGVPLDVFARFNSITNPDHIEIGQVLHIPVEIRVKPGDTVDALAAKYTTTPQTIAHANNINPDVIWVGQQLWV